MSKRKYKVTAEAAAAALERYRAQLFEAENWSLPPELRRTALSLPMSTLELLVNMARNGGLEIGDIGGELAHLSHLGLIEFRMNGGPRSTARCTYEGLSVILLRRYRPQVGPSPQHRGNEAAE